MYLPHDGNISLSFVIESALVARTPTICVFQIDGRYSVTGTSRALTMPWRSP